jgi:hypothetical protein
MSDFLTFNDAAVHTTGQKVSFKAPFPMTLVEVVDFRTNAAGTTGATVFDIEIEGTSALNGTISVASGAVLPTLARTFATTAVAKGELITIDCDSIASTAGAGFNAVISYVKGTEAGLDREGDIFTVAGVTSGHDHRFGQPANDSEFHDANEGQ